MKKIKNVSVETFGTDWMKSLKIFNKSYRKWFPRQVKDCEKPIIDLTFTLTDGTKFTKSYVINDIYTRVGQPLIFLPFENRIIEVYPMNIDEENIVEQFNYEINDLIHTFFGEVNKHNLSHEEVIEIMNDSIINHLQEKEVE